MVLEIIATNLTDVKQAAAYGANRLELSPAMSELGITPSYGLIKNAVNAVDIPINVIVRQHSQSFHYNENDLITMKSDIEMIKKVGASGVVIGTLTPEGKIDEEALKQILSVTENLDVTFHRAFDFAKDQMEALECLSKYTKVKRILTAGGNYNAHEAIPQLNHIINHAKDTHLKIMVGHGLRMDNFEKFYQEIQPEEVHFGSGARINDSFLSPIDKNKVEKINEILHR